MVREAIAAVEEAANARAKFVSSLRTEFEATTFENEEGAPVTKTMPKQRLDYQAKHLYSGNSHSPTDLPLESSGSASEMPRLGDRILNIRGAGVPFALRGTVIAIHQHTGHVEVSRFMLHCTA